MLKYIGNTQWLVGVPARDLTDAEVAEHGEEALLATGLYERPEDKPKPASRRAAAEPTHKEGDE